MVLTVCTYVLTAERRPAPPVVMPPTRRRSSPKLRDEGVSIDDEFVAQRTRLLG